MLEGKMFDAFNHRAAGVLFNPSNVQRGAQPVQATAKNLADPTFSPRALYWFPATELASIDTSPFAGRWIVGFKDVSSATNERTMIAAILPFAATNFSIRVVQFLDNIESDVGALLVAGLNSFAFDYLIRQSLGGLHVSDYITQQVPFIPPISYAGACPWAGNGCRTRDWLTPRVLELIFTAWQLELFAQDCGWSGPPFRWDEERRFLLRCELDAAFFHLYLGAEEEWRMQPESLSKDFPTRRHAVDHIMETFPIVKRKDEATHGEYRTKRVVLEIYDEIQRAMDTGCAYQTRLDPPPADPRVAHPADRARSSLRYVVQEPKVRKVAEGDSN